MPQQEALTFAKKHTQGCVWACVYTAGDSPAEHQRPGGFRSRGPAVQEHAAPMAPEREGKGGRRCGTRPTAPPAETQPHPNQAGLLGTVHRVVSPGGKAGKGSLTSEDRGEGRLRTGTRKKRGDWEEACHFTDVPIWLIYFATKIHGL